MDDSWGIRMEMHEEAPPRPKLPNYPPTHDHRNFSSDEDFTDVFGGPPRSILFRQFIVGFQRTSYYDIFRAPVNNIPVTGNIGRNLKEFAIPSLTINHNNRNRQNNVFYSGSSSPRNEQEEYHQNQPMYNTENDSLDNYRNYPFGHGGRNSSPETVSLDPVPNSSYTVSSDDYESDRERKTGEIEKEISRQEDDEYMRSYVIEINSDYRESSCESNGVEDAIAWANEKFRTKPEGKLGNHECEKGKHKEDIASRIRVSEGQKDRSGSPVLTELQILDQKIWFWSTGKETDIRLLLTSLHHILWPTNGWYAISLTNIVASSQVKKAYKKARFFLHPDKLQQKGATLAQKYIAEKAFSILQDAWATFTIMDVSCP